MVCYCWSHQFTLFQHIFFKYSCLTAEFLVKKNLHYPWFCIEISPLQRIETSKSYQSNSSASYTCVSVYICIYIYIYTHTYIHTVHTYIYISAWMKEHHLQLNLAKTELLVVPATPTLQHDFSIQLGTSIITPSTSVRNLGVIFDDQLTFKEHIAKTARSCRFALHNIRKIRPFLTEHAAQLLSRPLSFLGWTTAMLFWLDFHQTQSNLYKWFRMQRHDWSSMSPKEPMLHLSSSHCTGYQWQLASSSRHWCLHTERPQAQHPPTSTHYYESTSPPEVWDLLVSDALWYHHREAQNHSPEHSHSPFLAGGIIFPPLSGMLDPCQSSSNNWRLISFGTTWLHPKLVLKKKQKTFPFIFLSFPCKLVLIWTMTETWCYEHFLCLIASSRWIALCIPQL